MKDQQARSNNKFAAKLLFVILLFSGALALLVYRNFKIFEQEMAESLELVRAKGVDLSQEQCVDEVLSRISQCSYFKTMCEHGVAKLMMACLEGRDRTQECSASASAMKDSHFGYKECAARGQVGRRNKSCGNAYRAFSDFCQPRG